MFSSEGGGTCASSLLSVIVHRHGLCVVIVVHRCCGRLSSLPCRVVVRLHHRRCVVIWPLVTEGEAVWQWLAGVTVAAGLWLLEGERGGWWNSRHDVLACTTVGSDDGMRRCHLDVANLDGTVDVPRCLVVTWHTLWLSWLLCAEVGVGG